MGAGEGGGARARGDASVGRVVMGRREVAGGAPVRHLRTLAARGRETRDGRQPPKEQVAAAPSRVLD